MRIRVLAVLALVWSVSSLSAADVKITLSNVHLCCKSCVSDAEGAAKGTGATITASRENRKVVIVAKDEKSAQAALDAVSNAGYYGVSDHKSLAIKAPTLGDGKVASLSVTTHNCCAKCSKAIEEAGKAVKGVTGVEVASGESAVTLKGDVDPKAAVKAMNDAGFQINAKK